MSEIRLKSPKSQKSGSSARKPEKPKVEVLKSPKNQKSRSMARKPEKPKVEVFGSKTSTFGFSGFLTVFLIKIQAPVIKPRSEIGKMYMYVNK